MKIMMTLCNLPFIGGYITLFVTLLPFVFLIVLESVTPVLEENILISLGLVLVLVWNYFILRKRGLNLVTPIIPIPFWIISIIFVCIGTWHSYDILQLSYFEANNTPFTIESVEKEGVGNKRFVSITNGVFDGNIVYEYNEETKHVSSIIYPIISREQQQNALFSEQPLMIKILVKQKVDTSVEELDKWIEQQKIIKKNSNIKGIVFFGLKSIDKKNKALVQSNFHLYDNFIFLEEGRTPKPLIVSASSFFISIIGIILSFFVIKNTLS
jgi:hypothetical protein